jgi:DNA-directed RNA polymerase subunit RPC12/RpoP
MSDEAFFTAFLCPSCHTEIEATLDMVGEETECPACGARITVPQAEGRSDGGVVRHGPSDTGGLGEAMKRRTIRIELGDDL